MPDFPSLGRTVGNIQESRTIFVGLFEKDTLVAIAEIDTNCQGLAINSFFVDPAYFRNGYGGQLLHHILNETDCNTAVVETAAANLPALSLYSKYGFTRKDHWETSEGIPRVELCLNLPN